MNFNVQLIHNKFNKGQDETNILFRMARLNCFPLKYLMPDSPRSCFLECSLGYSRDTCKNKL